MDQTAKVYLAVLSGGEIEFSVEGPLVGGEVLSAFYLTERDARALHSQLGSVLAQVGILPVAHGSGSASQGPKRA